MPAFLNTYAGSSAKSIPCVTLAVTVTTLTIVMIVLIIITVVLCKLKVCTLRKLQCSAETLQQLTTTGDDCESAMDERGNYCIIISWDSPYYVIPSAGYMLGSPGYDPLSKWSVSHVKNGH